MKISFSTKLNKGSDLLIVPVFSDQIDRLPALYPDNLKKFIKERAKSKHFTAKSGNHLSTYLQETRILLIGAGKTNDFRGKEARELGGKLGKHAQSLREVNVTLLLAPELAEYTAELLQGWKMAQYDVGLQKTAKSKKKTLYHSEKVLVVSDIDQKPLKKSVEEALIIAESVHFVRDLVNQPANIINSEYLAAVARKVAKDNGFKKVILGRKELQKMKAGGILAVNQGCDREPKLLVLQYDGAKNKKERPIVLVGKGVVFDTGGYNLKGHGGIETMHQDMAGCATVLGVMNIIKRLGIKKNVVMVAPVVENLINQDAYRPSDIITMLSGHTVEITNTDAEGRLILADAIHYATELKPQAIITIATLTGASFIALGHRYCALLGNDEVLRADLQVAGKEVDELGWSLPIHPDYEKEMESKVADLRNFDLGSGGGAGTAKAAAFLQMFVADNKWAHLDIGGTAFTTRPKDYEVRGATAHGLRILLQYLKSSDR